MTDFEKGPLAIVPPRYSSTIPPDRRGLTSGTFRFDLSQRLKRNPTYDIFKNSGFSTKNLLDWNTVAVLLKSFQAWDLLPPEVRGTDCEERRTLIRFIAEGVPDDTALGSRKLPSADAIMIELARIVLGTINEWNILEPSLQMMLEHEMIEFIGQEHEEMEIRAEPREEDPHRKFIRELESNHIQDDRPSNYSELVEKARQRVIRKITEKIVTTVRELDFSECTGLGKTTGFPEIGDTTYVDIEEIEKKIRQTTAAAMSDIRRRDTIPATPIAKIKKRTDPPK